MLYLPWALQGMFVVTFRHQCPACPVNMCKSTILQRHLAREELQHHAHRFCEKVIYVGDGSNDLCPAQALMRHDVLFVRAGYGLDKLLQDPAVASTVAATTIRWDHASTILDYIQHL